MVSHECARHIKERAKRGIQREPGTCQSLTWTVKGIDFNVLIFQGVKLVLNPERLSLPI
jgi:hypothetical protein